MAALVLWDLALPQMGIPPGIKNPTCGNRLAAFRGEGTQRRFGVNPEGWEAAGGAGAQTIGAAGAGGLDFGGWSPQALMG